MLCWYVELIMWYPSQDPVKIVQCRECGTDVSINANYPVEAVDCRPWYCPDPSKKHFKNNKNL
jgi:ribosomal protein L40E